MVRAYHVILTYYGFWLPNDPRGSWSEFVGKWELYRYGRATKVTTGRSLAAEPHDHRRRLEAKQTLDRLPVCLDGLQARDVALGFAARLRADGVRTHALSVMPDHTHMVLGRTGVPIPTLMSRLKASATKRLEAEGRHPFRDERRGDGSLPKMFVRGGWKVFLNTPDAVRRAIAYAEANPVKEGKRRQTWSFVEPYEGQSAGRVLRATPTRSHSVAAK